MDFIKNTEDILTNIYKLKNIIWDFDGVIIDSVPTKTKAFAHIFKDFPNKKVEELLYFHQINGGISRFDKISYFFSNILKQVLSTSDAQKYASEFSQFSLNELFQPKYLINSTISFIEQNYKKYTMNIASGAWEVDLKKLCKHHHIDKYFVSINGAPIKKTELVKNILCKYSYNTYETCIIGDSIQDYKAAKDNGILYLGFNNKDMIPLSDYYLEDYSILEKN